MRRTLILTLAAAFVLLVALPVQANGDRNFVAPLDGDQENPPVDTQASGVAKFQFNDDSDELDFRLIVANIENVFASHIHCAPVGFNGPVGVTLFSGPTDPLPGTANGVLVQGTITAPNPGNACGWGDLADVKEAVLSGNTYVNVHTLGNPSGEIRGQIK